MPLEKREILKESSAEDFSKRPKRSYLSFVKKRSTRVGDDYQVASLPVPTPPRNQQLPAVPVEQESLVERQENETEELKKIEEEEVQESSKANDS